MGWIGELVLALIKGTLLVIKGLYSTDKPQVTTVEHAAPDVETDDEDDKGKLADLGL